jgi:ABC-type nitrate/sulfonate/bicarbonate transport system substrate-binding protein
MTRSLDVVVFPGGFNLPIWAGMRCGAFSAQDLEVRLHFTTGSMHQLCGLVRGEWEIGLTGFDNVVAYQEGQGEAEIDREPDLFVFMGGDNAFLSLVVRPEIKSYADLRGQTLSVDALTTGFAFVLRKMLASNAIAEVDMRFERAGGAMQRFEALKEGRHAGTLLVTPFDLVGQKLGLRVLQSAWQVLPHYQGICGTARRAWAKENPEALVAFIRGYLRALAWLYDRRNADAARALLVEKVPGMSAELAQATHRILVAERGGFDPKARLDMAGIETVLALRSEYGRPQKSLADNQKYQDMSFYRCAAAAMD